MLLALASRYDLASEPSNAADFVERRVHMARASERQAVAHPRQAEFGSSARGPNPDITGLVAQSSRYRCNPGRQRSRQCCGAGILQAAPRKRRASQAAANTSHQNASPRARRRSPVFDLQSLQFQTSVPARSHPATDASIRLERRDLSCPQLCPRSIRVERLRVLRSSEPQGNGRRLRPRLRLSREPFLSTSAFHPEVKPPAALWMLDQPSPRRAASIFATSIFPIVIIASNTRLATALSGSVTPSVS